MLLLDTIGELSGLFALADVVFMGGTLARRGGHNILEPALFGKPVIVGPHMENFQAIADDFRPPGPAWRSRSAADLAGAVSGLLGDPTRRGDRRAGARTARRRGRGATRAPSTTSRELYDPRARLPSCEPWFPLRWALARLWQWGAPPAVRAADLSDSGELDAPVISVGNLTMGGTGKTPCVLRLAEILKEQRPEPGILTRGYGRGSPEKHLSLRARVARCAAEYSGDEPQIFLRSGLAPVGIGGDRFQTATQLLRDFGVDVLVLDDGFQHVRLARTWTSC